MRLKYYVKNLDHVIDAGEAKVEEDWWWGWFDTMQAKDDPEEGVFIWFFTEDTTDIWPPEPHKFYIEIVLSEEPGYTKKAASFDCVLCQYRTFHNLDHTYVEELAVDHTHDKHNIYRDRIKILYKEKL